MTLFPLGMLAVKFAKFENGSVEIAFVAIVLPRLLRTEASCGASRLASRYSAIASSSFFCSWKTNARLECASQKAGFR